MRPKIRKIEEEDNQAMANIIRGVLETFGANRDGFAAMDPETDNLYQAYQKTGTAYWVAEFDGKVVGGSGIGKLKGFSDACELQKMYILPEYRGMGLGKSFMELCLDFAQKHYKVVYIETLKAMVEARKLYERYGFSYLSMPLGKTGHYGCDLYMAKYV